MSLVQEILFVAFPNAFYVGVQISISIECQKLAHCGLTLFLQESHNSDPILDIPLEGLRV
jgi:hypothetical protein